VIAGEKNLRKKVQQQDLNLELTDFVVFNYYYGQSSIVATVPGKKTCQRLVHDKKFHRYPIIYAIVLPSHPNLAPRSGGKRE